MEVDFGRVERKWERAFWLGVALSEPQFRATRKWEVLAMTKDWMGV